MSDEMKACAAETLTDERREIRRLLHEVEMLTNAGVIEVAVRNPSVAEYMKHWEDRATKAEAALASSTGAGASSGQAPGVVETLDAEALKARAAAVLCEAGTLCEWPAPNCNSREGAEALFKAGLLALAHPPAQGSTDARFDSVALEAARDIMALTRSGAFDDHLKAKIQVRIIEALAAIGAGGQAVAENAETLKARAASVLCEAGALCGWPAPNCNAREGAEALFKAGLLALAHPSPAIPVKEVERVLDWYEDQARAAAKYLSDDKHIDAVKAVIHALALDGGNRARALLSRLRAGPQEGWRDLESAPKTGETILLRGVPNEVPSLPEQVASGYWKPTDGIMKPGIWCWQHAVGPSFKIVGWMPLPAAPSPEAKGGDHG